MNCVSCEIYFDQVDNIPLCHVCYCTVAQIKDSVFNQLLIGG